MFIVINYPSTFIEPVGFIIQWVAILLWLNCALKHIFMKIQLLGNFINFVILVRAFVSFGMNIKFLSIMIILIIVLKQFFCFRVFYCKAFFLNATAFLSSQKEIVSIMVGFHFIFRKPCKQLLSWTRQTC